MKDFNDFKVFVQQNASDMAQEVKRQAVELSEDGDDIRFQMQVRSTIILLEAYHKWAHGDS